MPVNNVPMAEPLVSILKKLVRSFEFKFCGWKLVNDSSIEIEALGIPD